jgi:tRNA nucleotidyltransferase/poly(A) polymerase
VSLVAGDVFVERVLSVIIVSVIIAKIGKFTVTIATLVTDPFLNFSGVQADVFRRDLTVNSLFYNIHTLNIEDYTRIGLSDLAEKIIRTPVDFSLTFNADPIRAVRVLRYASCLNFGITADIVASCKSTLMDSYINHDLSDGRIARETTILLSSPRFDRAAWLFRETTLWCNLFDLPNDDLFIIRDNVIPFSGGRKLLQSDLLPLPSAKQELLKARCVDETTLLVLLGNYIKTLNGLGELSQRAVAKMSSDEDAIKDFKLVSICFLLFLSPCRP